jgi:phosphohistidine phosphatase
MNLYLLRHGIAVPAGTPGVEDHQRQLTPLGRKKVHQIASGFAALGESIDRIVTSPLPRALETAQIVAERLGLVDSLEIDDALHVDSPAQSIVQFVSTQHEANLLLVGHNPSLTDLIGLLTTRRSLSQIINLRRGGMAALSRNSDGHFSLDWLARPRLLRAREH